MRPEFAKKCLAPSSHSSQFPTTQAFNATNKPTFAAKVLGNHHSVWSRPIGYFSHTSFPATHQAMEHLPVFKPLTLDPS